jgi:hypothetical protein
MFDRGELLENCVAFLAKSWCPGGLVPFDSYLRAKWIAEQMTVAAARLADAQDGQLV